MKSKTCYAIMNQRGNFVTNGKICYTHTKWYDGHSIVEGPNPSSYLSVDEVVTGKTVMLFTSKKKALHKCKKQRKEIVVKVLITVIMENDK